MGSAGQYSLFANDTERWTAILLLYLLCAIGAGCGKYDSVEAEGRVVTAEPEVESDSEGRFEPVAFSSDSCRICHEGIFEKWQASHHALANRKMDAMMDDPAFSPERRLVSDGVESGFRRSEEGFEIETANRAGELQRFHPEMVLGHEPLRQYLVPFPNGRWQTTQVAWDPEKQEWFDVYEGEGRQPAEWGSWTNRGMNWNAQCAFCHMTNYNKGYELETDSYRSTWSAMGITCYQCHGSMEGHTEAVEDPTYRKSPPDLAATMDNCASCHSRHEELTGSFRSGDSYGDHFRLQLPVDARLYYPDGQVRDEVYVYGSFRMSRMGQAGVTCLDCHDAHSAELIAPVSNNALCMTCHAKPGIRNAPPIEPVAHSHHEAGSSGNLCIECHMPKTTFMKRDPRRDHGFTVPDPLMTRELGIPNACNACHADQSVAWAEEWVEKWYGERMRRPERRRTRALAKAHAGDPAATGALLELLKVEQNPIWRATMITLLRPASTRPEVRRLLLESTRDADSLIRSAAVQVLGEDHTSRKYSRALVKDASRSVRLAAAWNLRDELHPSAPAFRELTQYLDFHADQPAGAGLRAQFAFARGNTANAEAWFRKAVAWDPSSAAALENLALLQNARGRPEEALTTFTKATLLDPGNARYPFMMALIHSESGRRGEAERLLGKAVELDPGFARGWYNLGLIHAEQERLGAAIELMKKAEALDPHSPDAAYARATLHFRRGEVEEAREAAKRTLRINPDHAQATGFLKQLEKR